MILAFDQGAWHPQQEIVLAWLLSAAMSALPLFFLARSGGRRPTPYAGTAAPLFTLLLLNGYISYGTSGAYTGDGRIGPGAYLNIFETFRQTMFEYVAFFSPTLIMILVALFLAPLRKGLPFVYWLLHAISALAQLLFALVLTAIISEI